MHKNAPLPDKKSKGGTALSPDLSPTKEGDTPSPDPNPSAPSALGVLVPFHLRLEHWSVFCLSVWMSSNFFSNPILLLQFLSSSHEICRTSSVYQYAKKIVEQIFEILILKLLAIC